MNGVMECPPTRYNGQPNPLNLNFTFAIAARGILLSDSSMIGLGSGNYSALAEPRKDDGAKTSEVSLRTVPD
jgi:hypothetical protein